MPRNPDTCQNPPGGSLMLGMAVLAVSAYRATPRKVRCRRQGASCSAFMLMQLRRYGLIEGLSRGMFYIRDHDLSEQDVEQVFGQSRPARAPSLMLGTTVLLLTVLGLTPRGAKANGCGTR